MKKNGRLTAIGEVRKKKVSEVLYDVLSQGGVRAHLPQVIGEKIIVRASGKKLVKITKQSIETVVTLLTDCVFMYRSRLPDTFLPLDDIASLFTSIALQIKRLDHIGFCYMVSSQREERHRIKQVASETSWHLYEMESVDVARWYFIGERNNWQDPMIELLPVVVPKDPPKDIPYWMPHIHIDINTSLSADEIVGVIKQVVGDSRTPIRYTDPERGTHCVRLWLGTVSGVNINLDLSTKVRNLEWVRNNMLREIVG